MGFLEAMQLKLKSVKYIYVVRPVGYSLLASLEIIETASWI